MELVTAQEGDMLAQRWQTLFWEYLCWDNLWTTRHPLNLTQISVQYLPRYKSCIGVR
jgi:hypothetical protein